MMMYCVDGSICHFKFPNIVLTHILREVDSFYIVLLSFFSRTCVLIGSYLTNTEQTNMLAHFFETRRVAYMSQTRV